MACKCTQTTTNATGGGAITSALSACSYVFWYNQMSGCTGSALDTHNGNPGANILFQLGINDNGYPVEAYGTNNISIDNPNPLHRFSIGNQGNIDVEEYIHFGDGALTGNTGNNKTGTVGDVYLGYKAGYTRGTNYNSSYNTVVGSSSLGSTGVLNASAKNVVVGYETMTNATSSGENTIAGYQAGKSLTTGSRNVYLGKGQGTLETNENDTLRIGNKSQTAGGSARPLIQGDFATSATTLWGSARITDLPHGLGPLMGVDKQGYLHVSKFKPTPSAPLEPLGFNNMGVWTANTVDASTSNGCDPADAGCDPGYWDTSGTIPGYRSVSISGGTNHQSTSTDWMGTRVGIGTQFPEYPLHIKSPYSWIKVQSTVGSSWIESQSAVANAYLGVSASNGVKSGSTSWRMHAFTSNNSITDWGTGTKPSIGTGMTLQLRSQSNGDEVVTDIISIVGDDMSNNLDGAITVRSDEDPLGGVSTNPTHGIGIFTPIPTKELTLIGTFSGTGSIHSADYLKYPNPSFGTYVGYQSGSGSTTDNYNTAIGYQAMQDTGTANLSVTQRNTAVGYKALNSAGSAVAGTVTDNVAIGNESMSLNTGGEYNVAIGVGALKDGVDVDSHVAIGYQALESYTAIGSIGGNVGIGYRTMRNATEGGRNVGIGYYVAANSTNQLGGYNVYIGNAAANGTDNSGYGNVVLGAGAATGGTPANSTIAVGYNAQIPYDDDFFMNIGDIIYARKGDASATTGRDTVMIGSGSYTKSYQPDFTVGVIGAIHSTDYMKWPNPAKSMYLGQGVGSGTTGSQENTIIGYKATSVNALATAGGNTGLGSEVLMNLETGDRNIAIGSKALYQVEGSHDNQAMGYMTLASNVTGSRNMAIGSYALIGLNGTDDNMAIGYNSQYYNVSGGDNVSVGGYSQHRVTTGSYNTSIGHESGEYNQTGKGNVSVGNYALRGEALNTYSWNSAVGAGALSGITTGGCNVAVGNNAGSGVGSPGGKITSGSNNIVIGCQVNVKGGTNDNQINIGNSILMGMGNGSNTVLTHAPIDPIKVHDVYTNGDIIIKPTVGLIISASTLGVMVEGPIKTRDVYGHGNTQLGDMALRYYTGLAKDGFNTVVGYQAASNPGLNGFINSTAVGYRAFSAATTISSGTAVGTNAAKNATGANYTTAIGADALLENQTGAYNVAVGSWALKGVAANSNSRNTAIGHGAGQSITTGSDNVFLGYRSGDNVTTGSNNIAIGDEVDPPSATGSYQINIGNVLYGRDTDSDNDTDAIGINNSSPNVALDVTYGSETLALSTNTGGGEVVTFGTAGADYAAGFLVQLRGTDNWVKADADDTTLQGNLVGIALGAAPSNGILIKGFYHLNTAEDVTTWAQGGQLYVSTIDGKITESTGSHTSGDYVRVVGYMTSTDGIMYFNPESTYVVIT